LNVQENAPLEFVAIEPEVIVPTEQLVGESTVPPNETFTPELTENPVPRTVNDPPTGPWDG
jgi:hypothetical protein